MVGWLDDWTIGWLDDWTIGWLDDWTIGRLDSWTVGQLDSWEVGQLGAHYGRLKTNSVYSPFDQRKVFCNASSVFHLLSVRGIDFNHLR